MSTPLKLANARGSTTIRGVTAIEPETGMSTVSTLYAVDGRLAAAEAPSNLEAVIDGTGLFAIPGLIDMHVHCTSDPYSAVAKSWSEITDTTLTLSAVDNLSLALEAGVTSVRDLGAPRDLGYRIRSAWQRGLFVGSRPFVAGPVITATGGHGSWLGVESAGPAEISALVRANVSKGSDVIKLMMRSAARKVELRPAELEAAVAEAHWNGTPVAVHANFAARSIEAAVEARCDSVEHGFSITEHTASIMASQDTALCPTTAALNEIVSNPDPWIRSGGRALVEKAQAQYADARKSFENALAAGVTVVAGTDAGVVGVEFDAIAKELRTMAEWGAPLSQVLRAATFDAAKLLGVDELGTLAIGTPADVAILGSNPLVDVDAYDDVVAVVQGGRLSVLKDRERLVAGAVDLYPGALLPARRRARTHSST